MPLELTGEQSPFLFRLAPTQYAGDVHVRLDCWGVPTRAVPRAFMHMGLDRWALRREPRRPMFAKLLGTGNGETFTMRDADAHHWALLTTWADAEDAVAFTHGPLMSTWMRFASEHCAFALEPITSHGRWADREPFAPSADPQWPGAIAAITRARIRPSQWLAFWRSVPEVSADLRSDPGVLFTLGIGEAPVGLQGTFSVWRSAQAVREFAYRRPAHQKVIEETARRSWYSEELFARFAVLSATGTYRGLDVAERLHG